MERDESRPWPEDAYLEDLARSCKIDPSHLADPQIARCLEVLEGAAIAIRLKSAAGIRPKVVGPTIGRPGRRPDVPRDAT